MKYLFDKLALFYCRLLDNQLIEADAKIKELTNINRVLETEVIQLQHLLAMAQAAIHLASLQNEINPDLFNGRTLH